MLTVVVAIGRNIGTEVMPSTRWWEFKNGVYLTLAQKGTIVQRPRMTLDAPGQVGEWQGTEEDAATFIAFIEDVWEERLRDELIHLAAVYQQESIGLIVVEGTNHLVSP